MFYTYGLTAESGGAANYAKALSVASVQVPAASPRLGAQSLALPGVASSQAYVRVMAAGALRGTAEANAAALTQFKFKNISSSPTAVLAQSVSSILPYVGSTIAAVPSGQAWSLVFPRINYAVVAAITPNIAVKGRGFFRAFGVSTPSNWFSGEFTSEFGVGPGGFATTLNLNVGKLSGVTSPTAQAGGLQRLISKVMLSAHLRSQVTLLEHGVGFTKTFMAAMQSRVLSPGKIAAATEGEMAAVARRLPLRRTAANAQSALLGFGTIYIRGVGAIAAQAATVLRGTARLRHHAMGNLAALVKTPSRIFSATDGEAAALLKMVAKPLGAQSPDAASIRRIAGMVRSAVSPAIAALAVMTTRFRGFGAASGQVAALIALRVRNLALSVSAAQSQALSRLNKLSYLLTESVGSTQTIGVVRGISHAAAAVSAAALACVKVTGRSFGTVLAEVSTLTAHVLHVVLTSVAAAQAVLGRASRAIARGVTSIQAIGFTSSGRVVHATSSAFSAVAAALRRTVVKLLSAGSPQAAIVGRVDFKIISTASTNVAGGRASRALNLRSSHTLLGRIVSWYHLFVPEWAYQQTTLLPPGGGPAEPPSFGPIDPADQTTFAFDWSARADPNDAIASAAVVSTPAGMTFLGPVFISGTLVEVTALPFTPPQVPATYSLRCTCVFASGRRSSFSIPVPIRLL